MDDNTINFGIHNGKQLSDESIPSEYIFWLAKRGSYQEPGNRFNTTWQVSVVLSILARREAERHGYKREGDRYIEDK
jgi:uncharacterized protein (DUF3820 family)